MIGRMDDLLDIRPRTRTRGSPPPQQIDRLLCDYEGSSGRRRLSAVLDELTLTYTIVERDARGNPKC